MTKLLQIESLEDGWYGPGSHAVESVAIEAFRSFIASLDTAPDELEPFPTAAGGIRLEWERGESSYVAELGPDVTFLCHLAPSADDDREVQVDGLDVDRLMKFYIDSSEEIRD